MLEKVASVSDLLSFEHSKTDASVREGLTFEIPRGRGVDGRFVFGIPGARV